MSKIYCVVLLYNKSIDNSLTCNNLKSINSNNTKVLILDNSTREYDNEKLSKKESYYYISMNGNMGISKPYNKAIDYLSNIIKANTNDYIVWLDDDTDIKKEYFDELKRNIKENPKIDIFAPIIYGQDGVIYSPNNARYIKNKLVSSEKETFQLTKYNAINSCLCVKLSVYENYRYDEILFLDQTDQNFFDDMRKLKKSFKTINVRIKQNFSQRDSKLDSKKMLIRYKIRTTDIMKYGRKNFANTLKSFVKAAGLSVQIGLKCKSLKFILICLFNSIRMLFYNIKHLLFGGDYEK